MMFQFWAVSTEKMNILNGIFMEVSSKKDSTPYLIVKRSEIIPKEVNLLVGVGYWPMGSLSKIAYLLCYDLKDPGGFYME